MLAGFALRNRAQDAKRRPGGPTTRVPESEWEEERCGGRGLRTFRRAFPAASDLERNSGALSGWMAATCAMLPFSSVSK